MIFGESAFSFMVPEQVTCSSLGFSYLNYSKGPNVSAWKML